MRMMRKIDKDNDDNKKWTKNEKRMDRGTLQRKY